MKVSRQPRLQAKDLITSTVVFRVNFLAITHKLFIVTDFISLPGFTRSDVKMSFPTEGFVSTRALYPPVAESHPAPSGYIQDYTRIGYSRDIGRSSQFGGHTYYVFGDTFCKDRQGTFVGITSNTVAIMPDREHPLESQYLAIKPDGMVEPLLPLNEDEILLEKSGVRIVLWAFGGIVETNPGVGWTWYQKTVIYPNDYQHYHGVGIARISQAARPPGQLCAFRIESMLFGPDEPRIGSFSSLVHDDFVYLWGHHEGGVILARVHRYMPTTRNAYKYWNGRSYVDNWRDAIPVLRDIQHGCFFKSPLFGTERPWCFVGCTKFADSIVMIGAEASLEGPWSLTPLFHTDGIEVRDKYRYCMFAHPWACDADLGELLVTYSEGWPGGVVGAKVKLLMGN